MNIYPDWLKTEVVSVSGTIILNALEVAVDGSLAVVIENEMSATMVMTLPVAIDMSVLAVSLEGDLSIELDIC